MGKQSTGRVRTDRHTPLALVLTGGGARAAYQAGVLCAIAERAPHLEFPIVTGVSAGAINAVYLAAHRGPLAAAAETLRVEWSRLTVDHVYRLRPIGIGHALLRGLAQMAPGRRGDTTALHGFLDMQPLRDFLTAGIDLSGIDANVAAGRLRAAGLSATSYASGDTVTFVHGSPDVPTWRRALRYAVRTRFTIDHVMASAALPILFSAVRVGDAFYGDGSVRQTAPLAPAIHLGAGALLVITQRADPGQRAVGPRPASYPTLAEVGGLLLHSIFLDALEADVERLERLNRVLAELPAGVPAPDRLRPVRLLVVRPSRDLGELAVGRGAQLPLMIRWVVRGIGGDRATAVDFLSYLLFDPAYTTTLIELGYEDAKRDWHRIERFLASEGAPEKPRGP
jgi:NTE family protein